MTQLSGEFSAMPIFFLIKIELCAVRAYNF